MNLLITTNCNLSCPYCFSRPLQKGRSVREMTLPELETLLAGMDPHKTPVRLMGGEPTLHSQYREIIRLLKRRGFQVVVFTNGTREALHRTAPWLPDRVLLNLNDRSFYLPDQTRTIEENMAALGNRIELGYTVSQPGFDLDWHRSLIQGEGLQTTIRVGLAQPVIGGDNVYLAEDDLPEAHASVLLWAKRLKRYGIRLSLDCGFMRCLYDDEDIEAFIRAGAVLRFECSPAVDVGAGLQSWRCYAFSNQTACKWLDFTDQKACLDYFKESDATRLQQCSGCLHLESGWCQGGCKARALMQA